MDKNPIFLPVTPEAIFRSFQGKIISHFIDKSMISKIRSSFHLISDKAFQDWGFTFDRFVKIKNKGILHFVLKNMRGAKNKIKLTDVSNRNLIWTESNFIFPNYLNGFLENG